MLLNLRELPLCKTRLASEVIGALPLNAIGSHASAETSCYKEKKKTLEMSEGILGEKNPNKERLSGPEVTFSMWISCSIKVS